MTQSEIHIVDYGNLADWFSAVGTVLAVFLSLYLIWDERRIRFRIVAFIQDGTKEVKKDPGIISVVSTRKLIFSGMNLGKQHIAVLYQGLRVKKSFFGKENNIIQVNEIKLNDQSVNILETDITLNDFELLETGKQTMKRSIDFDVMKKELWDQFPEKPKKVVIEFVYINVYGKEYIDTLDFENPKLETQS